MSCSTIDHIRSRIEKRKPHFGSLEQWEQLYKCLNELGFVDYKIIDLHYKPFLMRYNNVMNAIEQRVEKNQIAEAIAEKKAFLKSLDPQFQQIKVTLENMAELVGKTTTRLQNYDL